MDQEYRTPQLQFHPAKKRIYQDRGEPSFYEEADDDYDLSIKKTKFIGLTGADYKIGPIFISKGFSVLEEDPKMIEQYCTPNFQPVSLQEEENQKIMQHKWQNRIENQYYTDDRRKWLEQKQKIIENEMYFYRKQQKSFEIKEENMEYYK